MWIFPAPHPGPPSIAGSWGCQQGPDGWRDVPVRTGLHHGVGRCRLEHQSALDRTQFYVQIAPSSGRTDRLGVLPHDPGGCRVRGPRATAEPRWNCCLPVSSTNRHSAKSSQDGPSGHEVRGDGDGSSWPPPAGVSTAANGVVVPCPTQSWCAAGAFPGIVGRISVERSGGWIRLFSSPYRASVLYGGQRWSSPTMSRNPARRPADRRTV